MTSRSISLRAWLELALLALIWGGVFLSTRVTLDEMSVMQAVTHRLIWGALALWIWVLTARMRLPRGFKTWAALAVMGGINNVLPFLLIAWAQTRIESGLAAIFNASTALFGVLVAALFLSDERLTPRKLAGVVLGFGGVVVAIGWESLLRFDPRSLAQLAVLAATLCYALAGIWARKRLEHLRPQVSAMGMVTCAALFMLALTLIREGALPMALPPVTLGAIAYSALIATALAYLLYYRILAMAGAGNLMLVTLMIPPVAILLGAWMRGEQLTANALAGFAILALGLVVLDGRALALLRRR